MSAASGRDSSGHARGRSRPARAGARPAGEETLRATRQAHEATLRDPRTSRSRPGEDSRPTRAAPSQRAHARGPRPGPAAPPERIGDYVVRETLGKGAMGAVYCARDPAGRDVAIKLLHAHVADEEGLARFLREGRVLAAIPPHRHVVSVHSAGEVQGCPYLVLDLVRGEDLRALLRREQPSVERAVRLAEGLARALEHIHRAGVVHRDFKPANVLVREEDGLPLLSDFGLAALGGARRLTLTGDVLGTPLYMAPEQIQGRVAQVDARSDIWALGVVLYEMLAGAPPFRAASLEGLARAIASEPLPSLRSLRPEVDPALEAIVARTLAKSRGQRFPDAGALAAALRAWHASRDTESAEAPPPEPAGRRRRTLLLGAGILGLLLSAGLWFALRAAAPPALDPARLAAEARELTQTLGELAPGPLVDGAPLAADRLEALGTSLSRLERATGQGLAADLNDARRRLRWLRLDAALRDARWEAGAALRAQAEPGVERTLFAARLAWFRGEALDPASLEAAAGSQEEVLAHAARVLWARALAPEQPESALAVLEEARLPQARARAERAAAQLFIAVREQDPQRSAALRERVQDARVLERARAQAVRRGLAWCEGRPGNRGLRQSLRVLAQLPRNAADADEDALGLRVLEQLLVLQDAIDWGDLHGLREVIDLLSILGESGLWVGDQPHGGTFLDRLADARAVSREAVDALQFARSAMALLRLDVRLRTRHLRHLPSESLRELEPALLRSYLLARVDLSVPRHEEAARSRLGSLVVEPEFLAALGPIQRARALSEASWSEESREPLELCARARALDPACPWNAAAYAHALARAGRAGDALDQALAAEELARAQPAHHGSEQMILARRLAFAYARLGDEPRCTQALSAVAGYDPESPLYRDTEARVQQLLREAGVR